MSQQTRSPESLPAAPDDPNQLQRPDSDLPKERIVVRRAQAPQAARPPVTQPPVSSRSRLRKSGLCRSHTCWNSRLGWRPRGFEWSPPQRTARRHPTLRTGDSCRRQRRATTGSHCARSNLGEPRWQRLAPSAGANGNSEYDGQNLQAQKESFLEKARTGNVADDYLKYTRTPPLSRFEIKAGWEIPAALEQGLNSDLPGELKALVMSNVYDTATGQYLLIPQGARLVGSYNSRVGYGQNGVQVAWQRVIFPDGSAIDLNGMEGLDAQGNAGLRDKVDHHYKQLLGVAVLTSMFDAALAVTQSRQQSVLVYPSPTQETEERRRSRGEPTRHTDRAEESQRSADDQDSGGLQVQRQGQSGHSLRRALQPSAARGPQRNSRRVDKVRCETPDERQEAPYVAMSIDAGLDL